MREQAHQQAGTGKAAAGTKNQHVAGCSRKATENMKQKTVIRKKLNRNKLRRGDTAKGTAT